MSDVSGLLDATYDVELTPDTSFDLTVSKDRESHVTGETVVLAIDFSLLKLQSNISSIHNINFEINLTSCCEPYSFQFHKVTTTDQLITPGQSSTFVHNIVIEDQNDTSKLISTAQVWVRIGLLYDINQVENSFESEWIKTLQIAVFFSQRTGSFDPNFRWIILVVVLIILGLIGLISKLK